MQISVISRGCPCSPNGVCTSEFDQDAMGINPDPTMITHLCSAKDPVFELNLGGQFDQIRTDFQLSASAATSGDAGRPIHINGEDNSRKLYAAAWTYRCLVRA